MIICLCNRVSERDISQAVRGGTHCFERLKDLTGVASTCGCCLDCARESFESALGPVQALLAAPASRPVPTGG